MFKLDKSYTRGKDLQATEASWGLGMDWEIDTSGADWDKLYIHIMLDLYRKKDSFTVASLHSTILYEVTKNASFGFKWGLILNLSNMACAQIQGAWRVKISNDHISQLLPQAFNRVKEMETEVKKVVYEQWE